MGADTGCVQGIWDHSSLFSLGLPETPHPKASPKITPTFTLGKTPKITQFNLIKHSTPTASPTAKTRALKFPESHPIDFPFPGQDSPLCPKALPSQPQPQMQPSCSCRAAEEPPKSTRLSWQSAQGGIKERLENPGKRFNMSSDKQYLTRWPKLGFRGFFSPSVLFHLPSAGIHRVFGELWGDSTPSLSREGFWAEPRCDTLGQPHAVTCPLNGDLFPALLQTAPLQDLIPAKLYQNPPHLTHIKQRWNNKKIQQREVNLLFNHQPHWPLLPQYLNGNPGSIPPCGMHAIPRGTKLFFFFSANNVKLHFVIYIEAPLLL